MVLWMPQDQSVFTKIRTRMFHVKKERDTKDVLVIWGPAIALVTRLVSPLISTILLPFRVLSISLMP